ncbi:S8 family peptidase [Clostridium sp. BJN0001]|uniref:S8 family peptidase n=1 Tax=Clostridium sp. BJN0001 TaxID=2930219 RepID=UPI001FD479FC|nr:S8 family peptidase [Clostridium sp. BJN0001]
MSNNDLYYNPLSENFLIEYRGNFKEEIDKIDYAVGDVINETLGVVAMFPVDRERLLRDVPSIIYIDYRIMAVLQDISPSYVDNINNIKINPYLNLNGKDVTVGIVDTGIDYLNEEFINEDNTSRILKIWDQSYEDETTEKIPNKPYIGTVYSNEQINEAIKAKENNEDPYKIVPSKDERDHGTKVAGIIGALGKTNYFQGIANRCNFVVVKLFESTNFKRSLEQNQVYNVAVYNISEIIAGLEFIKQEFFKLKSKAMVIYIGVGATTGGHDGGSLVSRYVNSLGMTRGLCLVSGVGNEGDSQGHVVGYIKSSKDYSVEELKVPREVKSLKINIWLQKPNKASINIISPTDESSKIIKPKINKVQNYKFVFTGTEFTVSYRTPDHFTGHDVIQVDFRDLKSGIWKIMLIGEYILNGRYDIWLPPHNVLPKDLIFLSSTSESTITIPSTASNVISVGYFGSENTIVSSSGKGFNTNVNTNAIGITPYISTIGENILTTKSSGQLSLLSGGSAASAIIAGACALLLQWGIVEGNDPTMYSKKIISYLMYGATRNDIYKYPNKEMGYGEFNLLGVFNIIAKLYRTRGIDSIVKSNVLDNELEYDEYFINNLFIRSPKRFIGGFVCKKNL